MAKMQPGTYKAQVLNYTISQTKAGDPQVEVLFEYNDGDTTQVGGTHHQVRWWGSLKQGKGQEWTLKTLDLLGFSGKTNEDFAKLADGFESGMLDPTREVSIVLEEDAKDDGRKFIFVKYVNDLNRAPAGFKSALSRGEANVKLGALNLAGQMAMLRSQAPAKAPATRPIPAPAGREPGDDVDFDFGVI
jgi:hypothetical protein